MMGLTLNHITYIPALAASLLLAGIVFANNRKHPANLSFTALILALCFWIFSTLQADTLKNPQLVLIWNRLAILGPLWIPSLFLAFSINFPNLTRDLTRRESLLLFLPPLFTAFLVPTNWNVSSVQIYDWGSDVTVGPLYSVLGLFFLIYMGSAAGILYNKYRRLSGIAKAQIKFLGLGVALTALVALTTNLILPILGTARYSIFGPPSSLILVSFVTYAIIRHRLMDIRLAIRAGILKLLMAVILAAGAYLLAQGYLVFLVEATPKRLLLIVAIAAGLVVLVYEPLNRFISGITDRVLFQREYSHQDLLKNLSKTMAESLKLDDLLLAIESTLKEVMRVKYVGFALLPAPGQTSHREATLRGFESLHYEWKEDDLLFEQVRANPQLIVYDELTREVSEMKEGPLRVRLEQVLEKMRQLEAGVVLPLPATEGVIGVIVLGEKIGGDAFNSSDLSTLETLMYQMATSIENASLFAETQSFNVKLRQEVARATDDLQKQNRKLSVLRRLDAIIINTLELSEMCQKIVDTVAWEMGYLAGFIALLEKEGQNLRAKAASSTPRLKKALEKLPQKLTNYVLDLRLDPSNAMTRAIHERRPIATDSFAEVYSPPLNKALADELQKTAQISHHVVYPLSAKGKALGVVVFGLPVPYSQLDEDDKDLLQAFMDEAGIAVENAQLYQELKAINQQLAAANEKLKSLDKMKDELVSVASHELRTPMTAIKSYLWMVINEKAGEIKNPKMLSYLKRAYESSERMINLVNDMLSVSRLDTGQLELELKPTDLKELVEGAVVDLAVTARQKGVTLTYEKPASILPKVLADEDRIREVLNNLIDNGIKFTPEGGRVLVNVAKKSKTLEVSISDTGPGIPREDLPRLFQKFGRLENSFVTAAETGGTGLGLYISRGIVELHHGKIWVRSKVGEGSTFIFSLRIVENEKQLVIPQ